MTHIVKKEFFNIAKDNLWSNQNYKLFNFVRTLVPSFLSEHKSETRI